MRRRKIHPRGPAGSITSLTVAICGPPERKIPERTTIFSPGFGQVLTRRLYSQKVCLSPDQQIRSVIFGTVCPLLLFPEKYLYTSYKEKQLRMAKLHNVAFVMIEGSSLVRLGDN